MDHDELIAADMTPAARQFIQDYIQSVWQLELIIMLKGNGNSLSAAEIASRLYFNPRVIESALSGFVRDGILKTAEPAMYVYDPDSVEMFDAIEQASSAYANKRLAVINYIFSKNREDRREDKKRA